MSPIKNLSDSHTPGSGFPRIGKLKKGLARSEEDIRRNRAGKESEFYRITFDQGYEYLQEIWSNFYGDELRVLPNVYLMSQDVDEAFSSWRELWGSNNLIKIRCNGEQQVRHFDEQQGRAVNTPAACGYPSCGCKETGRLNIILPDLMRETGVLGFITLETHSIRDISTIYNFLCETRDIYGGLMGIPYVLGRKATPVEVPEIKNGVATGKRFKSIKQMIAISVAPEYVKANNFQDRPQLSANVDPSTGEYLPAGFEDNYQEFVDDMSAVDIANGLADELQRNSIELDELTMGLGAAVHEIEPDPRFVNEGEAVHWASDASQRAMVMNTLKQLGHNSKDAQSKALNRVDRRISDKPVDTRLGDSQFPNAEELIAALRKDAGLSGNANDWNSTKNPF